MPPKNQYDPDGSTLEKLDNMLDDTLMNETEDSMNDFIDRQHAMRDMWKPEPNEKFFYVGGEYPKPYSAKNDNRSVNNRRIEVGNCFRTYEECEECAKTIRETYEREQAKILKKKSDEKCRQMCEKTCQTQDEVLDLVKILNGHEYETFFSAAYGEVTFLCSRYGEDDDTDIVVKKQENIFRDTERVYFPDGKLSPDGMCDLWPSKSYYQLYPLDPYGAWMRWNELNNTEYDYDGIVLKLYGNLPDGNFIHWNNMLPDSHMSRLTVIHKLMNIKRYLEGDDKTDWFNLDEKFYIGFNYNDECVEVFSKKGHVSDGNVYFKTQTHAKRAIQILGDEVLNLFNN